jgi:hypothetical protein
VELSIELVTELVGRLDLQEPGIGKPEVVHFE